MVQKMKSLRRILYAMGLMLKLMNWYKLPMACCTVAWQPAFLSGWQNVSKRPIDQLFVVLQEIAAHSGKSVPDTEVPLMFLKFWTHDERL